MTQQQNHLAPLMEAVNRNDLPTVQALIKSGSKLNTKSREGLTALHYAVQCGYSEIALVLIEAGADVNIKDRKGKSVLMEAIRRRQNYTIEALLKSGADIHVRSRSKANALMDAAIYGPVNLVYKLVSLGADVKENNSESLVSAVSFRNSETATALINLGSDPNAFINANGRTLLMTAVSLGDEELVKVLLEAGANFRAVDYKGLTALDIALEEGHRKIASILRQYSEA